jgi:pyruvate/2-oxoglutarate dehydrogenase complex dihydrolipoamide acyltransferase (E2) component
MSILLVAFFSFTPAFGQPPEDRSPQPQLKEQKEEPVKEPEPKKTADANTVTDANVVADANTVADANAVADPNAVRAKIEKFEGLSGALAQINTESSDEISKWTLGREEKLNLALAVQKQITAEFKFLRELAVKEGAAKTTAAIDGIVLDRQKRFKDVIEKLEKETERYRRFTEREEKRKEQRERSKERPGIRRDIQ